MVRTAINDEDARNNGVYAEHERMENGEVRCRFKFKDGTAYIRTEASSVGGWQRSHYHNLVHETYIVETGRIAFVDQCNGRMRLRIIGERGIITTEKRVIHNVYMFSNSIIHTVKHATHGVAQDWHSAPDFDALVCHLTVEDIVKLGCLGEAAK